MFDFEKPNDEAKTVVIEGDFNMATLNPHGISVWKDEPSGECQELIIISTELFTTMFISLTLLSLFSASNN